MGTVSAEHATGWECEIPAGAEVTSVRNVDGTFVVTYYEEIAPRCARCGRILYAGEPYRDPGHCHYPECPPPFPTTATGYPGAIWIEDALPGNYDGG